MSKKDRAALTARLKNVSESISGLRAEVQSFYGSIGRSFTRLAVLIHEGSVLEGDLGKDWRSWATVQCAGFGAEGSNLAPPTVYRLRNAGAVAAVLDEAVGEASYTTLVPLYRVLAAAQGIGKTDEDVKKAEAKVSTLWDQAVTKSRNGTPSEESVRTLVERAMPKGTRGAAGKTAADRKKAAEEKAAKTRNTPTAKDPGETGPETVTIDPAAVEAAGKIVSTQIRGLSRQLGITQDQVRPIMLATLRLIREHGTDTIAAALAAPAKKVAAPAAAKTN